MEDKEKLGLFIDKTRDVRELKRALSVRMKLEGKKRAEIGQDLRVSIGFVDKYWRRYRQEGVAGLKLRYKGDPGKLTATEQKEVIDWLEGQGSWDLGGLQAYLQEKYGVVYKSRQSYYDLFKRGGISWKKTQKRNPAKNEAAVREKRELVQKN